MARRHYSPVCGQCLRVQFDPYKMSREEWLWWVSKISSLFSRWFFHPKMVAKQHVATSNRRKSCYFFMVINSWNFTTKLTCNCLDERNIAVCKLTQNGTHTQALLNCPIWYDNEMYIMPFKSFIMPFVSWVALVSHLHLALTSAHKRSQALTSTVFQCTVLFHCRI